MDLVIIYGPPAAGKLTVAKELQKLTGYKLFHNHLTNDLIHSLFDYDEDFFKLANDIRLKLLETAARRKVRGVIFTFCYAKGDDDPMLKRFMRKLQPLGVRFHYVHLKSRQEHVLKRATDESRKKYGKLRKRSEVQSLLEKHDFYTAFDHPNTLQLDNTALPPKKAARAIQKHFEL